GDRSLRIVHLRVQRRVRTFPTDAVRDGQVHLEQAGLRERIVLDAARPDRGPVAEIPRVSRIQDLARSPGIGEVRREGAVESDDDPLVYLEGEAIRVAGTCAIRPDLRDGQLVVYVQSDVAERNVAAGLPHD